MKTEASFRTGVYRSQVTDHRSPHPSCHLVLARPSGRTPHSMRAGHSKVRRATRQAERRPQIPHHFAAESYWRGPIPMPTIILHMSRGKTIMQAGTLKSYEIPQTALLHHSGNICADRSKEIPSLEAKEEKQQCTLIL